MKATDMVLKGILMKLRSLQLTSVVIPNRVRDLVGLTDMHVQDDFLINAGVNLNGMLAISKA